MCGDKVLVNEDWVKHGIVMWASWTIVGLLQIYTNRYMMHQWKWRGILHNIAGSIASFMVMFSSIMAMIEVPRFRIFKNPHRFFGFSVFCLTVFLALGGIISAYLLKFKTSNWGSMKSVKSKKGHQYLGLISVAVAQYSIITGI